MRKINCFLLFGMVFLVSSCSTPSATRSQPSPKTMTAPVPVQLPKTISSVHNAGISRHIIPKTSDIYHTVAPGETLWRISKMYGVDVDTIKTVNHIRDVRDIDIGTRLLIPKASDRKEILTLYPNKQWKYIIIHHSATEQGNCEFFDNAHKRKGWQGVGYHFVINNGTCGKEDGQIEATPRWINQSRGAHCSASSMNYNGIGICLVGNISKHDMTSDQMKSLVYLVKALMKYYEIPRSRVLGHGKVRGANTECPGKLFPWTKFYRMLR